MRSDLREFRNALSQACKKLEVRYQELTDAGLAELLDRAEADDLPLEQFIAFFLCFCRKLDSPLYQAGFLAVMAYLNETRRPLGDQAYRDLHETLRQSDNPEQVLRWFQGYR